VVDIDSLASLIIFAAAASLVIPFTKAQNAKFGAVAVL
jgi:hypothetical protein